MLVLWAKNFILSTNPLYTDPVWLTNAINTKSIYDIAVECGVAHSTIRKYLKRFGIKSRSISEAMKLKYQDPEYLDKRREQWHSEEFAGQQRNGIDKERSSETSRKLWQDKDFADKCLTAHSEAMVDPEVRKLISEASKRNWQNDNYRAKQDALSEEKSERLSKIACKLWNNPEYRKAKLSSNHLEGEKRRLSTEEFIRRAKKLHGDDFDYSKTNYITYDRHKVAIICNNCDNSFGQLPGNHLKSCKCPYCHSSQGQREVYNFVRSLGFDAVLNDRSKIHPLELDIFIPDKNFAIEYHGLWWHSYDRPETKNERFRLQDKAIKCLESDIQLLQFFNFQWDNKKDIVKSMIQHKLGLSENRFFARDLKVVDPVDNELARKFFDSNHLFGNRDASRIVGLFSDDIPIMMLSASDGEIIRFAAASGCSVCGGLSRLLKRVVVDRTYADLCFSNAVGYFATGFKSIGVTKPGYFYYRGDVILSRQQCQKSKLGKFLEIFDENLSESVNMFINGYRRVWNAGNLRLVR